MPSQKKQLTLCFVQDGPRLLLGMKKRGFGAGRWNGFGGKVDMDESIEDAARRELKEECSIEAAEMEKRGILEFAFRGDPTVLEVHVFKAGGISGQPQETGEMRPEWFDIGVLPFEQMWPDDRYWLPLFLEGKKFIGTFLFEGSDKILAQSLLETDQL